MNARASSQVPPEGGTPFPSHLSAALAFLTAALFFALHAVARRGFEIESSYYASGLALSAVLNFGPLLLRGATPRGPGAVSLGSLVIILVTAAAGWLLMEVPGRVEIGLWVAAVVVGALVLKRHPVRTWTRAAWMAPLLALAFAFWLAVCFWSAGRSEHISPLFFENLAKGSSHVDTLFHSSIAAMLQTHHVPSTGLDGIVYMAYHWGSHLAVAGWSKLCGMLPVEFYTVVFMPVFLPWLLASLLELAAVFVKRLHPEDAGFSPGRWFAGAGVLWLTQQHVTLTFFDSVNHSKLSQSFILSMIWFIHLAVLADSVWRQWNAPGGSGSNRLLFRAAGLLALFALGMFLKISTAVMFGAVFAVVAWVRPGWRSPRYWITGGVLGLVLLALGPVVVNLKGDPMSVHWVGGMHVNLARSGLSYAGYYASLFWPWFAAVAVVLLLVRRGALSTQSGQAYWRFLCMAAAISFFGELPNLLTPSNGSNFFSKVMVTAMPAVLVAVVIANDKALWQMVRAWWNPPSFAGAQRLLLLMGAATVLLAVVSVLKRSAKDAGHLILAGRRPYLVDESLKQRVADALKIPHLWHAGLLIETSGKGKLRSAASLKLVKNLLRRGRDPLSQCREEALYVPRDNAAFWELLYANTVPYVAPALTRRCMVFGLPDPNFKGMHYGLARYPRRFEPVDKAPTPAELEAARQQRCPPAVKRVLVVDDQGEFRSPP